MNKSVSLKKIRSSFVKQLDSADCGVACLLSIIQYFGGFTPLENLREISGTTRQGTTLLGLYQAAVKTGMIAQGLEGTIDDLKGLDKPCILHVYIDNTFLHYLVCYGFDGKHFIVGDPSHKVEKCPPEKLLKIWKSKSLLLLFPNESFKKSNKENLTRNRWTIHLLKSDISLLVIVGILGVIISVLGLAQTVFSQQLIDKIIPGENK